MKIRLHLHTCNLGATSRTYQNPFTGEPIEVPNDSGLSEAERANVRTLLADRRASDPDPDGYRKVHSLDGGVVSVCIGTLEDLYPCIAFAVEVESLTPDVVSFIFDLAQLGNMSVGSTINPEVVLLTKAPENDMLAKRWPTAVVETTPMHLESWLKMRMKDKSIA